MQLQGVKNLPKLNQYTEESFQELEKKQEEYRKYSKGTYQLLEDIIKASQSYCISFEKSLITFGEQQKKEYLLYFEQLIQLFNTILVHRKQLSSKIVNAFKGNEDNYTQSHEKQLQLLVTFHQKVKFYQQKEQFLVESHKNFTKLCKSMISNVEIYKESFTDVKLIYNRNQKLRRYQVCQTNYEQVMKEHQLICQLVSQMTCQKEQLVNIYSELVSVSRKNIRVVGQKIKIVSHSFVKSYCQLENNILISCNASFQKMAPMTIQFSLSSNYLQNEEKKYLEEDKEYQYHPVIPAVVLFSENIKETHYPHISIFLIHLEKELFQTCKRRKQLGRQIMEMVINFEKVQEKYYGSLRDFSAMWEKRKKKSVQYYGTNSRIFPDSFGSVFQICLESADKIPKFIMSKMKLIDQLLGEESKILDNLFREYKQSLEKLFMKKESKKSSIAVPDLKKQNILKNQPETIKKQTMAKLEQLRGLFELFYQKIKKNNFQIKGNYDLILQLLETTSIENYANIKEQIEMGIEKMKPKVSEDVILETIASKTRFYEDCSFGSLLGEERNKIITFDPDLNKIEDFQKLKKPVELLDDKKETQRLISPKKEDPCEETQKQEDNLTEYDSPMKQMSEIPSEGPLPIEKPQNTNKNVAFLQTKVSFSPSEKYYKSFICGLQDKIILSGRIFITNERLCFFSKFNPKNIFFGETFIEIPRKDIKKIEKRINAVIFDNSISITTIHGELFFTSFLSRNACYDTILEAMEITLDEFMYVEEKNEEEEIEEVIQKQGDDLKEQSIPSREKEAKEYFDYLQFDWKTVLDTEFCFPGLNVLKFFKIFETSNEMNYNRSKYKGFNHFFKQLIGHTNLDLEDWTPNIQEYLNSGDLKEGTPLPFTRVMRANVPIPPVPFMPKESYVVETLTLFFISKDKYQVHTICKNSGIPFGDDFLIHYRKEVEGISEDKISYKIYFHVHFINNIMMKNIIASKSYEESKVGLAKMADEMKKYLKHLSKTKNKGPKVEHETEEEGNERNFQQINEDLSCEVQDLKKQREVLTSKLSSQRSQTLKLKVIVVISILLNICLMLMVFKGSNKEQIIAM